MICLGLSSSHQGFSIAITDYQGIFIERSYHDKKMIDQAIIPAIQELLDEKQLSLDDIDVFALDQGPGSFTGLRVGFATIKGLVFGRNVKVVVMPSLLIRAFHLVQHYTGDVCIISDARRGLLYTGFFHLQDKLITPKSVYALLNIEQVMDEVKDGMIIAGDGVRIYRSLLEQQDTLTLAEPIFDYADAAWLVRAVELNIKENDWGDITTLTPMYLYPEDCQIKKIS